MCQGFSHFRDFLHYFALDKLVTNIIRVKMSTRLLFPHRRKQNIDYYKRKTLSAFKMLFYDEHAYELSCPLKMVQ